MHVFLLKVYMYVKPLELNHGNHILIKLAMKSIFGHCMVLLNFESSFILVLDYFPCYFSQWRVQFMGRLGSMFSHM